MYALVEDNQITKIITNPKPMIINDVQYPAKIFQLWSKAELNAIGIYEVVTDLSNKKDEQYYINTNEPLSLEQLNTNAHDFLNMIHHKKKNINDGLDQLKDYLRFSNANLGVWFNGEEKSYIRKIEKNGNKRF